MHRQAPVHREQSGRRERRPVEKRPFRRANPNGQDGDDQSDGDERRGAGKERRPDLLAACPAFDGPASERFLGGVRQRHSGIHEDDVGDPPPPADMAHDPPGLQDAPFEAKAEVDVDAVAGRLGGGPCDVGVGGARRRERANEPFAHRRPKRVLLPFGQGAPCRCTESPHENRVRVERFRKKARLRAAEKILRRPARDVGGLLDVPGGDIGPNGGERAEQDRDRDGRGARRAPQAAIGSSRATRGDRLSEPRSVTRMSSSMRTPNRPRM